MSARDYVSQITGDGSGHERCGPAIVASVLLSAGWVSDPTELMLQVDRESDLHKYGSVRDVGTDDRDLIECANRYGFEASSWVTWKEATDALAAGHAVLYLHENHLIVPRPYPNARGWNATHWSRLYEFLSDGETAYIYDPLTYLPQPDGSIYQGPTVCTVDSLRESIRATPYAYAGVIIYARNEGERLQWQQ